MPESEVSIRQAWPARFARNLPLVIAVGIAGVILGLAWFMNDQPVGSQPVPNSSHVQARLATRAPRNRTPQLLQIPPVQLPKIVGARFAGLPDDAKVLGVEAGNRHRAYAVSAFTEINEHVMNDLVGDVPITVTYCNRTRCARVFTDPKGNQPLNIAVGGWTGEPGNGPGGELLLRIDSNHYYQDTGEALEGGASLPYPQIEFEQTTWGNWRKAHPDTDVLAGPPDRN